MWRKYAEFVNGLDNAITVIPGLGAGNLKELISLTIAWADNYVVVLDKDKAGDRAIRDYKKFFLQQEDHFIQHEVSYDTRTVILEDLLSKSDQERICEITGSDDAKTAITQLYFMDEDKKTQYFDDIDETTRLHLTMLSNRIEKILSGNSSEN